MLDLNRLFNNVTERDLDEILRDGEGLQIEFKEKLPSILDFAKNVTAFANTQGGVLIVGARESKPQIVTSGPDPKVNEVFDGVGLRVRPVPEMRMHRLHYRGAIVPVIVVKAHPNELVVSDAGAFIRVGERTAPMPGDQVLERLNQQPQQEREERSANEIAGLTRTLDDLTKKFDELTGKFDASQAWGGQGKNLLVGCAGSTLSTILVGIVTLIIGIVIGWFIPK